MGRWTPDPGFGVYVHIPFCTHRCHYCDFNTYEGQDDLHGAYVDALITDIEAWTGVRRVATSVFFGGGTPTLLAPEQLGRILRAVEGTCGIAPGAEATVEANPETVDERAFEGLLAAGFNRVSIGVQSLVPKVLVGLGRTHSPERALDAIAAARRAGVADVSADLIYGSPWESADDWVTSLTGVIEAGPDHVSAYALTIEDATPLATLVATGRVPDVDPDLQAARHAVAGDLLGAAGFERYEVSNWAQPGRASAHNVLYWCGGDYLGFGAGAHGHLDGERFWSVRLPRDFIAAASDGRPTRAGGEVIADDARAGEAVMLGLRLTSGIDTVSFDRRFGSTALQPRAGEIDALCRAGLLERSGEMLRMTERGTMLASEIAARLL
jgi:oxygen-independent coproporphyrinogen-3 oxidase